MFFEDARFSFFTICPNVNNAVFLVHSKKKTLAIFVGIW